MESMSDAELERIELDALGDPTLTLWDMLRARRILNARRPATEVADAETE